MKEKRYPFGGKVVVLGGDFRQILPVIPKGTRYEIVQSTRNSSHLWQHCEVLTLTTNMRLLSGCTDSDVEEQRRFSEWILGIGDGSIGDASGDPLAAMVESTYPNLLHSMNDPSIFRDRAILAPKNAIVDAINISVCIKYSIIILMIIYYSVGSFIKKKER
jgi:ATP-dependent DNA helicase PIF1